jgi:hypothetical protein
MESTNMKLKTFWISSLLGCLVGVSITLAQQNKPRPTGTARFGDPTGTAHHLQNYIYGVVKKIGKDQVVLDKTEFGDDQPFKLEPKTKYVRDGKPGKLDDFKVGEKVFVQMKKDKKTGDMIAKTVVTGVASEALP